MNRTAFRFAAIGLGATLVHIASGALLIGAGAPPLTANMGAFLGAFCFSFLGHHFYSFAGHGLRIRQTLVRFAGVAWTGFVINEAALALLMQIISQAVLALTISTLIAAVSSYFLNRLWVFRKHTLRPAPGATGPAGSC